MSYKLVVVDLDGTLLNNKHTISKRNYKVISELRKKGVSFVLASGRPYQSLEKYAKKLNLKMPIISTNGALIKDVNDPDILFKSVFSYNNAEKIFNYGMKNNFSILVYYTDEFLSSDKDTAIHHKKVEALNFKYSKNLRENKAPLKIVFKAETGEEINKLGEVNNIFASDFYITQPDKQYIAFMNKGISKGRGIDYIKKYYDIKREEIIAIGNNFNDISMFDNSGLSIAMGNSPKKVKNEADFIKKSNEEDGVAVILKEIFAEISI